MPEKTCQDWAAPG